MKLYGGKEVIYDGPGKFNEEGLTRGDQGKVMVLSGPYVHVLWTTGQYAKDIIPVAKDNLSEPGDEEE